MREQAKRNVKLGFYALGLFMLSLYTGGAGISTIVHILLTMFVGIVMGCVIVVLITKEFLSDKENL